MEKKMTRRIIGILVVVALVVILLPLMFNENETPNSNQTAEVTAPPFPEQKNNHDIVVSDKGTPAPVITYDQVKEPEATTPEAIVSAPVPVQTAVATTPTTSAVPPTEKETPVSPNAALDVSEKTLSTADSPNAAVDISEKTISTEKETNAISKLEQSSPEVSATPIKLSDSKSAWVVQMGSFKNQNNAKQLIDSLREKGYKAFTVETKSNGQTRVYVGPEPQKSAAVILASKIEHAINMRGVVLMYKPLEL
jgi:DedD protein